MSEAAVECGARESEKTLTREEFEVFYRQSWRALRSYLCRLAGSADAADDIVQESYVRLLSAPAMPECRRKSYLYRTATNLVMDGRRAEVRARRWWQRLARGRGAAEWRVDLASDVEKLFGQLKEQERALLWLAYVEGMEHREIAAILNVRLSSVRVLLYRARRRMEMILRKHGFEAGR